MAPTPVSGSSGRVMLATARRYPLASFFAIAFGASAIALILIGPPSLADTGAQFSLAPLLMFPFLVLTVGTAGVVLSGMVGGQAAVRRLLQSVANWRVRPSYYIAVLLPPAAILATLLLLRLLAGPAFAPNLFPIGIAFGIVAGFFEEFGWTGFAYPRMRNRFGALRGAAMLGLLWGLWHLPVADSLGIAAPHGRAWPLFFGGFMLMLVALRMLIAWVYTSSGSLLLAQLTHASSTGFLVVLGPAHVTASQEASWYSIYALLLGTAAFACWRAWPLRRLLRGPAATEATAPPAHMAGWVSK